MFPFATNAYTDLCSCSSDCHNDDDSNSFIQHDDGFEDDD